MSDLAQGAVVDKRAVALAFSRAASTYNELARIQQRVGSQLLQDLAGREELADKLDVCLDLGAGTGIRTSELKMLFAPSHIVSLDIALGMCRRIAKESDALPVAADFDFLPLKEASVGLVYANFALQWSNGVENLLAGLHRALSPQGVFGFTTLLAGTLGEVNQAWEKIDPTKKNIVFPFEPQWRQSIESKFLVLNWQVETIVDPFPDIKSLLCSIKGIGAANHSVDRTKETLSRGQYQKFIDALEQSARKPKLGVAQCSLNDSDQQEGTKNDAKKPLFGASYRVLRAVCQKK